MSTRAYGWKKQQPDFRDKKYKAPIHILKDLPSKVDLRDEMPNVYVQNGVGCCVTCAIAANIEYLERKELKKDVLTPSRLFMYYNSRVDQGTEDYDSGTEVRTAIKVTNRLGFCDEGCAEDTCWNYLPDRYKDKPPQPCYDTALGRRILDYSAIDQNEQDLKSCLADGYPVAFGFTVYNSFNDDQLTRTGMMPVPQTDERVEGGHSCLICGFNDAIDCFIVRNSWGLFWGDKGYFYYPYSIMLNTDITSDFWTIRYV